MRLRCGGEIFDDHFIENFPQRVPCSENIFWKFVNNLRSYKFMKIGDLLFTVYTRDMPRCAGINVDFSCYYTCLYNIIQIIKRRAKSGVARKMRNVLNYGRRRRRWRRRSVYGYGTRCVNTAWRHISIVITTIIIVINNYSVHCRNTYVSCSLPALHH